MLSRETRSSEIKWGGGYPKDKIKEIEAEGKNKNISDLYSNKLI